jgi:hypothetical protein
MLPKVGSRVASSHYLDPAEACEEVVESASAADYYRKFVALRDSASRPTLA